MILDNESGHRQMNFHFGTATRKTYHIYAVLQELCSSLIFHLGKMRAHSEALSVYNMLRYSKRSMCKALHEKILHILISGKLLKDAYVVVKVCYIVLPFLIDSSTVLYMLFNLNYSLFRTIRSQFLILRLRSLHLHL